MPVTGHFSPVAKALVERGHEVRWYTSARFQAKIEATGARFIAFQKAQDIDYDKANDLFPERTKLTGWRQLHRSLRSAAFVKIAGFDFAAS